MDGKASLCSVLKVLIDWLKR